MSYAKEKPKGRNMFSNMPREVWAEEYHDFVRMRLSQWEIARAFGCTLEALEHRKKRCGIVDGLGGTARGND